MRELALADDSQSGGPTFGTILGSVITRAVSHAQKHAHNRVELPADLRKEHKRHFTEVDVRGVGVYLEVVFTCIDVCVGEVSNASLADAVMQRNRYCQSYDPKAWYFGLFC